MHALHAVSSDPQQWFGVACGGAMPARAHGVGRVLVQQGGPGAARGRPQGLAHRSGTLVTCKAGISLEV